MCDHSELKSPDDSVSQYFGLCCGKLTDSDEQILNSRSSDFFLTFLSGFPAKEKNSCSSDCGCNNISGLRSRSASFGPTLSGMKCFSAVLGRSF